MEIVQLEENITIDKKFIEFDAHYGKVCHGNFGTTFTPPMEN
jgi:hypothetical protein